MRLAALELAAAPPPAAPPDVIVATSLMSAADLRAALPPALRATPLVLYMHENQAAYPTGPDSVGQPQRDVHFALTNLASVLTADSVIWNSAWNRDSFVEGMTRILRHAPDLDRRGWRDEVLGRSQVIWPPVEPPPVSVDLSRPLRRPTRVVWPHRWEHDKGPDELLEIARRETKALDLRWIILGEQFRRVPPALEQLAAQLGDHVEHMGFVRDRSTYWRWLHESDWVLSTARHEFFGVAVVEALLAGCLPWLPPRLSYPELLPAEARGLHPAEPPADPERIRAAVARSLQPALAPVAVGRLDDALRACVERTRPR